MTFYTPTFNVEQFELRDQINPYLTEDQTSDVSLTVSRVNEQLNWVAQLLGWNGPNYWNSLVSTPDEKRQLLTGSFGVYNSFTLPRVLEVRNWSNEIVIENLEGIKKQQICYLGSETAVINNIVTGADNTLVLSLSSVTSSFYQQFANNEQLKIDSRENRPAPFNRPSAGASADASFICGVQNNSLILYPSWDVQKTTPYKFNILIWGARYYFNQPVYFSLTNSSPTPEISPIYDPILELWYLDFQDSTSVNPVTTVGYLVWSYSNTTVQQNVIAEVILEPWKDPSDWNIVNTLNNFSGVWSNKGGALPFNFCFDALNIHGYDEQKSLYLNNINRNVSFNDLLRLAYFQQTPQTLQIRNGSKVGEVWWNSATGVFSVYPPSSVSCGSWLEVQYRENPEPSLASDLTFSTVAEFQAAATTIPLGSVVRITDVTGLQANGTTYQIQGITSPLPNSGEVLLSKLKEGILYTVEEFIFTDVNQFKDNAVYLPINSIVRLVDPTGLKPSESGDYIIDNLEYIITSTQAYEILLIKQYSSLEWRLTPSSILRFIGNTRLYNGIGDPEQGEMWWDFTNPDPLTRAAAIWYQSAWVTVSPNVPLNSEPGIVSYGAVKLYCDGNLLTPGVLYYTENYTFAYTVNSSTGNFEFTYVPITFLGKTQFPQITVSDALTSAYRVDISYLVFSGVQYYMSPNVLDSETPLRLWKESSLQVVNSVKNLTLNIYENPLVADLNSGPSDNWSRYFLRLPPSYQRNDTKWLKANLIAQDFAYYGSTTFPEQMECYSDTTTPAIYEELVLYPQTRINSNLIYSEPYLYSNVGFFQDVQREDFSNAAVLPAFDTVYDQFDEAYLQEYSPLHNRIANTTSSPSQGYGDWEGVYLYAEDCQDLSGFVINDKETGAVQETKAPIEDASIYKFPPLCTQPETSFSVDANLYKTCYAYFAADLSAAEDGFFDIQQPMAWRHSVDNIKTGYVLSAAG
jgi:hypothetical protein